MPLAFTKLRMRLVWWMVVKGLRRCSLCSFRTVMKLWWRVSWLPLGKPLTLLAPYAAMLATHRQSFSQRWPFSLSVWSEEMILLVMKEREKEWASTYTLSLQVSDCVHGCLEMARVYFDRAVFFRSFCRNVFPVFGAVGRDCLTKSPPALLRAWPPEEVARNGSPINGGPCSGTEILNRISTINAFAAATFAEIATLNRVELGRINLLNMLFN